MTRTTSPLKRRIRLATHARIAAASALSCASLLLVATSATAAQPAFCVSAGGPGACPAASIVKSSIERAAADANEAQQTTVYLTPGTYTAVSSFDLGQTPLKIVGIGSPKPVLTAPAGASGSAVVSTLSPLLELINVTIAIPASTGMIGLKASNGGQEITDLSVRGPAAAASVGIAIGDSNPTITNADITLDGADGSSSGITMYAATTPRLEDVRIANVANGVEIGASVNFSIRRARLTAPTGLKVRDSDGTISSSLVEVPAGSAGPLAAIDTQSGANSSALLNIFNCTVIQRTPAPGTAVSSSVDGANGQTKVNVDSSIISGFQTAAGFASDPASLAIRYSAFDGELAHGDAGTVSEGPGNRAPTADYGFVDRAGGDFHLVLGSTLVDRGNPVIGDFTQADSGNDLDSLPRVVSRGAGKVRDIGAFEVQNTAPTPVINVVTAVPSTTSTTEFSAAGSSDAEGDALSFEWSFDGLPGPGGISISKRFIAAGPHNAQLTVTDRAGASSTIRRQFTVEVGYLSVKLRSESTRISRRGYIRVTLSCPVAAISDCSGRLVLKTSRRVDAKRYTKRPGWISRATHIEAANHVFSLAPGETRRLLVRTFKTFQNVLAVKKRFRLTGALADATTGNAKLVSNRATYTISAPRSSRHRK